MKHLSRFVRPGARRLKTADTGDHLAFENPDGTLTLVLVNTKAEDRNIKISCRNSLFSVSVKAKSFNTFNFNLSTR
jgi:glucosylceramidase